MEIKFKKASKTPEKNVTQISLVPDKSVNMFVVEGGQQTLQIGIGDPKKINHRKLVTLARKIVKVAKTNKVKKLAVDLHEFLFAHLSMKPEEVAEILATNFELANYEFLEYRKQPESGWDFIEEISIQHKDLPEEVKKAIEQGQIIGQETNRGRTLVNTPSCDMTPPILAAKAQEIFKGTKVKTSVLGQKEMAELGMNAVLAVSKGSVLEPKFIVLEYMNGGKEKPLVLVGKAVTFDTGGLCLKPGTGLIEMNMDMAGGACVISALAIAEKLKLKKNIVGLIPTVENILSATAYHVHDIIKTMSGITVEVLNTDAEGRLILADALTYAKKYDPRLVVDIATLTGAARVALGVRATAMFTKDEKLERTFRDLGEQSGDYVWPLPMWEEYEDDIKGSFGDICNVPLNYSNRHGGCIVAALFLYQFAKDYPWVHLDIVPRMTSTDGDYLSKGSTGEPVRLLTKVMQSL